MPTPPRTEHLADVVGPAGLIADRSRAAMLEALAEGEERSGMDLAAIAGTSPQTASAHLAKLAKGRLVVAVPVGRMRYYRLASAQVSDALRALSAIAQLNTEGSRAHGTPLAEAIARTCYDHLAGRLGVDLTDALLGRRIIARQEGSYRLTVRGAPILRDFGLNLPAVRMRYRAYALPCLDRTERRPHLAGSLGAAIASRLFQLGWVVRVDGTRTLRVTRTGERGLRATFGIEP
jgi:DNA-binding transcriptional ArsR family regulator